MGGQGPGDDHRLCHSCSAKPLGHILHTLWLLLLLLAVLSGGLLISVLRTEKVENSCNGEITHLRSIRNTLSARLNNLSKQAAILSCQNNSDDAKNKVSNVGGWCEKMEDVEGNSYGHSTDQPLARGIAAFLKGKKVASFGDGRGHYKAYIDTLKLVQLYDAYDGGPFYDIVSGGKVKYIDLTIPQYGMPVYDWIISLEVAEHIPKAFEATYLDNIARHAEEGIILSWAIPGQPGVQHVNLQPLYYVCFELSKLGFTYNEGESKHLRQTASLIHLKNNVAVFRRNPTAIIKLNNV